MPPRNKLVLVKQKGGTASRTAGLARKAARSAARSATSGWSCVWLSAMTLAVRGGSTSAPSSTSAATPTVRVPTANATPARPATSTGVW